MGARTKARKRALDVLFEADQRGYNVSSTLDQRILLSGRETPLPAYSVEIVRGVVSRWVEINAIIQDASPKWTMARMPGVDRALLRIATWEILCNDDVPTSVAIDEAVTLATQLSTDDSAKFVNGLLSTIAKDAPALSHASAGSAASATDDDEVESADGAAIFDSLLADPISSPVDDATSGATGAGAEDDSDEPDADADFADSGLSDALAKEWAERLLADDEATLVPMRDAEQFAAAEKSASATEADVPSEADGAEVASTADAATTDTAKSGAKDAAEAPEPTHLQD
ncbi:transcription antitermination factor NusB [Demequina aurantiaca]|uniref:transcription antitermination factor NusB n=1 Tax=Demequina aurantiaca TaxID=676200 RepID=UPI000A03FFC0